jgi:hypothetical protein
MSKKGIIPAKAGIYLISHSPLTMGRKQAQPARGVIEEVRGRLNRKGRTTLPLEKP